LSREVLVCTFPWTPSGDTLATIEEAFECDL